MLSPRLVPHVGQPARRGAAAAAALPEGARAAFAAGLAALTLAGAGAADRWRGMHRSICKLMLRQWAAGGACSGGDAPRQRARAVLSPSAPRRPLSPPPSYAYVAFCSRPRVCWRQDKGRRVCRLGPAVQGGQMLDSSTQPPTAATGPMPCCAAPLGAAHCRLQPREARRPQDFKLKYKSHRRTASR